MATLAVRVLMQGLHEDGGSAPPVDHDSVEIEAPLPQVCKEAPAGTIIAYPRDRSRAPAEITQDRQHVTAGTAREGARRLRIAIGNYDVQSKEARAGDAMHRRL